MRSAGALLALACAACGGASSAPARSAPPPAPVTTQSGDPAQRFAELGRCALEGGDAIEGCRLGYRVYGKATPAKDNVVLFPTYFTGNSGALVDVVVDKLVDTKRFQVVIVDALGDGVSSSPSNSTAQPRTKFPHFSVEDMVEAEKRLVVEVLGVKKLHAVAGISMGGMQALAWGAKHPELVSRVVSIAGTPKLTSSDLLLWSAEIAAIEDDAAYRGGAYEGRPMLRAPVYIHELHLTTPANRSREMTPDALAAWKAQAAKETWFDWNDWKWQAEAMMRHDVGRAYGGLTGASKRMPELLVVVAEQDQMVNPGPALELAKECGAEVLVLHGDCGHAAPSCEADAVRAKVRTFLAR